MIFCTGLSIKVFNALFKILKPHLPTLVYWRGRNAVAVKPNKCKRQRKFRLLCQNQMLLVLMRLRLGILMQDLAMRFDVSVASCSAIFTTWIKFLSSSIANALVIWLPKETILSNLPMVFVKGGYKKTMCIIDCTEIYIERPNHCLLKLSLGLTTKSITLSSI